MSKELHFRKLFLLGLAPLLFSSVISVYLALNGHGVWSLVWGQLAGTASSVVFVWYFVPWRPSWMFDLKIAKQMFGFGSHVSLQNILVWGITTADDIFVGRFLGAKLLGIYQIGFNMGLWTAMHITGPLVGVLFPTFSKLQSNREECKKLYIKAVKLIAIFSIPTGLLIGLSGHLIVPFLLGGQWLAVIPLVQILSIVGIAASIVSVAPNVYQALGRPDIMVKFFAIRLVFSLPAYYYSAQKGLVSLCFAHLFLVLVFAPINFYISTQFLNISFKEVVDLFYLPVVSSLLMSSIILAFIFSIPESLNFFTNLFTLTILVILASSVYILSLRQFGRSTFMELKRVVHVALT